MKLRGGWRDRWERTQTAYRSERVRPYERRSLSSCCRHDERCSRRACSANHRNLPLSTFIRSHACSNSAILLPNVHDVLIIQMKNDLYTDLYLSLRIYWWFILYELFETPPITMILVTVWSLFLFKFQYIYAHLTYLHKLFNGNDWTR